MFDLVIPNRLSQLQRQMDQFLGHWGAPAMGELDSTTFLPPLNLWEDAQNVYAEVELPGIRLEDVEISVVEGQLVLRGTRKYAERENATCHRRERTYGEFTRAIRLPVDIDPARAEAVLTDGVLTVTLPKSEQSKPRRIEIRRKD